MRPGQDGREKREVRAMSERNNCSTCRHMHGGEATGMQCRFNPPTVAIVLRPSTVAGGVPIPATASIFPPVNEVMVCSKWEARPQ